MRAFFVYNDSLEGLPLKYSYLILAMAVFPICIAMATEAPLHGEVRQSTEPGAPNCMGLLQKYLSELKANRPVSKAPAPHWGVKCGPGEEALTSEVRSDPISISGWHASVRTLNGNVFFGQGSQTQYIMQRGELKELFYGTEVLQAIRTTDGKRVTMLLDDGTFVERDLMTGAEKRARYRTGSSEKNYNLSADCADPRRPCEIVGTPRYGNDGDIVFIDTQTLAKRSFKAGSYVGISPDYKYFYRCEENRELRLRLIADEKKVLPIKISCDSFKDLKFSDNGKSVLMAPKEAGSPWRAIDLTQNTPTVFSIGAFRSMKMDSQGNFALVENGFAPDSASQGRTEFWRSYDLHKKTSRDIPISLRGGESLDVDSAVCDGDVCTVWPREANGGFRGYYSINLRTGNIDWTDMPRPAGSSADIVGDGEVVIGSNGGFQKLKVQKLCVEKVSRSTALLSCPVDYRLFQAAVPQLSKQLSKAQDFCSSDDPVKAKILKAADGVMYARGIGDPVARSWFAGRLQDPSALDAKNAASVAMAHSLLIDSAFTRGAPDRAIGLLVSLMARNPSVAASILAKNPSLGAIKSDKANSCVGEKDADSFAKNLSEVGDALLARSGPKSLGSLKSSFLYQRRQSPRAYEATLHDWASRIRDKLVDENNGPLKTLFSSRVFYFTQDALLRHVGLPEYAMMTAGEAAENPGLRGHYGYGYNYLPNPKAVIYSTEPLKGSVVQDGVEQAKSNSVPNDLFYVYEHVFSYPDLNRDRPVVENHEIQWKVGDKEYKASLKLERDVSLGKKDIKLKDGAKISELWADGKLTGLMVPGSNMGQNEQLDRVNQYMTYYQGQGFEFSTQTESIDTHQFVTGMLASGEADYLIKESHSGGNDADVMEMSVKSDVKMGVKKMPDGKQQVVYLLSPSASNDARSYRAPTHHLTRSAFTQNLKAREKANKGELIYFNTSCHGAALACRELGEARSPLLTDIASDASATVFYNEPRSNVLYHLVDSLVTTPPDGTLLWKDVRARIDEVKKYRDEIGSRFRGYDNYYFPDQPEYTRKWMVDRASSVALSAKENGQWQARSVLTPTVSIEGLATTPGR
ncbi:MAG: hypothetical protein JST16_01480 [Bdellovibrionales bacterium]|nr:hypothetical protein [Bdellovibrionales bacterium]